MKELDNNFDKYRTIRTRLGDRYVVINDYVHDIICHYIYIGDYNSLVKCLKVLNPNVNEYGINSFLEWIRKNDRAISLNDYDEETRSDIIKENEKNSWVIYYSRKINPENFSCISGSYAYSRFLSTRIYIDAAENTALGRIKLAEKGSIDKQKELLLWAEKILNRRKIKCEYGDAYFLKPEGERTAKRLPYDIRDFLASNDNTFDVKRINLEGNAQVTKEQELARNFYLVKNVNLTALYLLTDCLYSHYDDFYYINENEVKKFPNAWEDFVESVKEDLSKAVVMFVLFCLIVLLPLSGIALMLEVIPNLFGVMICIITFIIGGITYSFVTDQKSD